ncbi:MAG: YitT family protein [Ruminococcus sp.]|nr:YitT family protein [Ruminococcus sp.]
MSEQFASDTSGRTIGEWIKALIILFLGLTIAHLGVTLFLLSETGTDTFTVFIQGLASTAGLTVGTMHVIVSVILMVVMVFTTKGYVKPGTIVCAFCGGPIIDVFRWIFEPFINGNSPMPVRIVSMLAGCVILALGMSIVINSNAGTGPNDLVAIILTDKIKKIEFRWVRMGCDVMFVVLGFLLGGVFGVGTIVAVFLTGPVAQFWLPKTKKLVRKVLAE